MSKGIAALGGGGAFTAKEMNSKRRLRKVRDVMGDEYAKAAGGKPTVHLSKTAGPEVLAHEMGHIVNIGGKGSKIKRRLTGTSRTGAGTQALASYASHPVIDRLPTSEDNKRRLHLAAGAMPAAGAVPKLADEAVASIRGMKILRKAGFGKKQLSQVRRELTGNFGTYVAGTVPNVVGTGAAGAFAASRKTPRTKKK